MTVRQLDRAAFVERFGGVFEHSPWVAETAYEAGLDQLTDEERARFTELNDAYKARFGFPFIMAVKGRSKAEIMEAFERRIAHDRVQEFATALDQILSLIHI